VVTITEGAVQLLSQIQTSLDPNSMLRVVLENGELVIGRSDAVPGDEIYFHAGAPILRLTSDAAKALAGWTVATEETTEGTVLAILPASEHGGAG
jgi:hypothetical protein